MNIKNSPEALNRIIEQLKNELIETRTELNRIQK